MIFPNPLLACSRAQCRPAAEWSHCLPCLGNDLHTGIGVRQEYVDVAPTVSAERRMTDMPARLSLRLPPSLWAVMSDETVGLRWICHSVAPLQADQGKRNQGCPAPPPLSVRVAWPLLETRVRVGRPWFSRYCSVPLASSLLAAGKPVDRQVAVAHVDIDLGSRRAAEGLGQVMGEHFLLEPYGLSFHFSFLFLF